MANEQDEPNQPQRFQFSLRTLLLFVGVVCLVLAWFASGLHQAGRHRQTLAVVRRIESMGGFVSLEVHYGSIDSRRGRPNWLDNLFGDPGFPRIFSAALEAYNVDDDDMVHLQGMAMLDSLDLTGSQVTDAGLVHLEGLANLKRLFLDNMQVTDSGLAHLNGLTNLAILGLSETQVSDTGLVHLRGLINLGYLDVQLTQVTDTGIKDLQQALPNCTILH